MMKRFLCGAMAVALAFSTASVAGAASVPKAKYTFNMNKKSKKVVAVARKGDTTSKTVDTSKYAGGVLPKTSSAKSIKLKYTKGKNGKALFLARPAKGKAYGAQLKGIKLGKKSWTVSFWVKSSYSVGQFMPIFFTCNKNVTNTKKATWISITRTGDGWLNGISTPCIWSHNASLDKSESNQHFPWYAYQNEDGKWVGSSDDAKAEGIKKNKWTYVTLVVDAKDTCEYGTKGEDGYVKSYHAFTYVNGELFGNGTVAKNSMSNSNKFFLGINCWDLPFKGYFDDVQFWKKALTAKQVKKLYKKMK